MPGTVLWVAARALILGLFAFGLCAHAVLCARAAVPVWLLPATLLAGAAGAAATRAPAARAGAAAPRWLVALGALVLAVAFAALVHGSLATPSREWDGFVSWTQRARYLVPPATLEQPFFLERGVLSHSRSYPLLVPLALGSATGLVGEAAGRLLFPLLFAGLIALVGGAVARLRGAAWGWNAALAACVTPLWLNVGGGSVDSGYAEVAHALALVACGAGLVLDDALLLGCGAGLLPLLKPEGQPHAALLCLVCMLGKSRKANLAAVLGVLLAELVWLPVLGQLVAQPTLPLLGIGAALGGAGLALAIHEWRRRFRPRQGVVAAALGAVALCVGVVLYRVPAGAVGDISLMWLIEAAHALPRRVGELPHMLLGAFEYLVYVRHFGLVFVLLAALALLPRGVVGRCPAPALGWFVALGLLLAVLALLSSPETNLAHELRSRFDRLLLQWTGAGWLLAGLWLGGMFPWPAAGPAAGLGDARR